MVEDIAECVENQILILGTLLYFWYCICYYSKRAILDLQIELI